MLLILMSWGLCGGGRDSQSSTALVALVALTEACLPRSKPMDLNST